MAKYSFLVLTNSVKDRDEEFNGWYNDRHIPDVLSVDGFTAAQRFHVVTELYPDFEYEYLALYEIDTEDVGATIAAMRARSGTDSMMLSDAFDREHKLVAVFEELGDRQLSE
jgi:hypothetical protein